MAEIKDITKFHIFSSAYFASAVNRSQYVTDGKKEIAFIGRSNVGKSSLINSLTGRKKLAYVSREPGKTRTINYYAIQSRRIEDEEEQRQDWYLVDLPGYGYAQVSKSEKTRWARLIDEYFNQDRRFALVCCLVDIRHDASNLDISMVRFLQHMELPYAIVFTKADKLSNSKAVQQKNLLLKQLGAPQDTPCALTSSQTGKGIEELQAIICAACDEAC